MEFQVGGDVQLGGKSWKVSAIDPARDVVELVRIDDDPLRVAFRDGAGSPFVHGSYERVQVTTEQLMREQVQREAFDIMGRFTGVQSWGRQADPKGMGQARVEAELKANLAQMGIKPEGGALADMIKAVAAQFAAVSAAAQPSSNAIKNFVKAFEATNPEQLRSEFEEVDANRQAELDARFNDPECDGIVVFWHEGELKPQRPGVRITFADFHFGDSDDDYERKCEQVGSLDDAWAFVDYLNDDEAGTPMAIRDGAVVIFYHGDAGWESLSTERLPDAYRES